MAAALLYVEYKLEGNNHKVQFISVKEYQPKLQTSAVQSNLASSQSILSGAA